MKIQGKTINGYTLQRQLGVGGMAEVWLAENKIGKKSAVKLLLPKFCNDENIVERFENEAKVMVQLEHPFIRQVFDYDQLDGSPCILMEYLEGGDLKAMMKQGHRFSDQELEKWWNQMVQALNYTHSLHIVHRYIKPSNIFIDKHGNVRLMDFGIAKNNEGGSGTLTGSTLGTRIYMSPEQVKDPKRVDYRTDLYSLAVTFVHLLTGKAPYDSTSSSDFEIQMNIVMKPLDLSNVRNPWKGFLEPYLEKDPDKRPALNVFDNPTVTPDPDKDEETVVGGSQNEDPSKEVDIAREPVGVKDSQDLVIDFIVNNGYGDKASFVMKRIEGGTFYMGSYSNLFNRSMPNYDPFADNDEGPVHKVTVDSFYLMQFELTDFLFDAIMGYDTSLGSMTPHSQLSWNDCQRIIQRLNVLTGKRFRLPTEAEWEYAARGGNKGKGYRYAGSDNIHEVAWYEGNCNEKPQIVGNKKPNELGLYDMCGNLNEWCEDRYGDYSIESQINPHGSSTGNYRVLRGGCWGYVAKRCRISNREYANADSRSSCYGLRLALSC